MVINYNIFESHTSNHGHRFFISWALWQKLCFILLFIIMLTLSSAFAKLYYSRWCMLRYTSISGNTIKEKSDKPSTQESSSVPFGARALFIGVKTNSERLSLPNGSNGLFNTWDKKCLNSDITVPVTMPQACAQAFNHYSLLGSNDVVNVSPSRSIRSSSTYAIPNNIDGWEGTSSGCSSNRSSHTFPLGGMLCSAPLLSLTFDREQYEIRNGLNCNGLADVMPIRMATLDYHGHGQPQQQYHHSFTLGPKSELSKPKRVELLMDGSGSANVDERRIRRNESWCSSSVSPGDLTFSKSPSSSVENGKPNGFSEPSSVDAEEDSKESSFEILRDMNPPIALLIHQEFLNLDKPSGGDPANLDLLQSHRLSHVAETGQLIPRRKQNSHPNLR